MPCIIRRAVTKGRLHWRSWADKYGTGRRRQTRDGARPPFFHRWGVRNFGSVRFLIHSFYSPHCRMRCVCSMPYGGIVGAPGSGRRKGGVFSCRAEGIAVRMFRSFRCYAQVCTVVCVWNRKLCGRPFTPSFYGCCRVRTTCRWYSIGTGTAMPPIVRVS